MLFKEICFPYFLVNYILVTQKKKMNTVIIDDDKFVHTIFRSILKGIREVTVLKQFLCPRKALNYLETHDVDLVFLDIQMPDFSGLDFLNELNKKRLLLNVVVVTSNAKYAINVINNKNVIYFIKKPLHEYSIKEAIKATKEKIKFYKESYLNSYKNQSKKSSNTHTFFSSNRRMVNLNHDDIEVIKSLEGGVKILTIKEEIISSCSLKEAEEKLPPSTFIRIHKSYIINAKKIELIYDNLVIINKHHIPIGRTYNSKFKNYLNKT